MWHIFNKNFQVFALTPIVQDVELKAEPAQIICKPTHKVYINNTYYTGHSLRWSHSLQSG